MIFDADWKNRYSAALTINFNNYFLTPIVEIANLLASISKTLREIVELCKGLVLENPNRSL
jgi:hypothetical protein